MAFVKLTPEQIQERAETLAGLEMRYESEKKDAAELASEARESLKELRAQIVTLSRDIEAGEILVEDQLEIGSGPDAPVELPEKTIEDLPDPFLDDEEAEDDF